MNQKKKPNQNKPVTVHGRATGLRFERGIAWVVIGPDEDLKIQHTDREADRQRKRSLQKYRCNVRVGPDNDANRKSVMLMVARRASIRVVGVPHYKRARQGSFPEILEATRLKLAA